ncbi:MAG: hypothetical protein LBP75_03945 [Planctomycetota bacterium]|jgi:hypothetical protein|nr:hypothetical protein [Planctomycetota bacterium]
MSEITETEWAAMKKDLDDFCQKEGISSFKPLDPSLVPTGENMLYENSDKDASKILVAGRKREVEAIDWMLENMPDTRRLYVEITGREYRNVGAV